MFLRSILEKEREYIVLLTIFVIAVLFTLYVYTQHNLVYGIDGPYYIIQYYSIAYTGAIKYPGLPLAFYILYPFQYILNKLFNDPGLGLKTG
mgnify:CR=1 FL=1